MRTKQYPVFVCLFLTLFKAMSFAQNEQPDGLTDSLDDVFPLALNNQWYFTYAEHGWNLEAGIDTYWDGQMHFRVTTVMSTQDSSVWGIEQVRDLIYRFYRYGILVNTYPMNDTLIFELVERHDGQHQVFRLTGSQWYNLHSVFLFTRNFISPDTVVRYRRVDSTGVVAFRSAPYGYYPFYFSSRRGVGILSLHGIQGGLSGGSNINCQLTSYSITSADEARQPNTLCHFNLEQNFPNPFNPTTVIRFSIAKRLFVTLRVYDALGKEVANVLNGEMQSGTYEQAINMSHASSGVYFYRLQAGEYFSAKPMLLLK